MVSISVVLATPEDYCSCMAALDADQLHFVQTPKKRPKTKAVQEEDDAHHSEYDGVPMRNVRLLPCGAHGRSPWQHRPA